MHLPKVLTDLLSAFLIPHIKKGSNTSNIVLGVVNEIPAAT